MSEHTCTTHEPGTYGCYTAHSCHCDACLATSRRRRKLVRHGVRQTVDATRVQQHIARLGVPNATIAKSAGVSPSTVGEIVRGVRPLVTVAVARKILAVCTTEPTAGLIPAAGTIRRLRALIAIGHTQDALSAAIGSRKQHINKAVHGAYKHAEADFATRVRVAYEQLWDACPTGPSATRSINLANRHGWVPPLAWDDGTGPHGIDNPDATPVGVRTTTTKLTAFEDIVWLAECGVNGAGIARQLGVRIETIERVCHRNGRGDLWHKLRPDTAAKFDQITRSGAA